MEFIWNGYTRRRQALLPYVTLVFVLMIICVGCQADSTRNDPLTVTAVLVELLQDPSLDVRRTAALSLGKIGHSAGTQGLAKALSDPDPLVREYSAWALGQIGEEINTDAALAVVSALGDEHPAVKQSAAKALGNIGIRGPMIPLLIEGLKVGEVSRRCFEARIRELIAAHATLSMVIGAMLTARAALWSEFTKLHREMLRIARADKSANG